MFPIQHSVHGHRSANYLCHLRTDGLRMNQLAVQVTTNCDCWIDFHWHCDSENWTGLAELMISLGIHDASDLFLRSSCIW